MLDLSRELVAYEVRAAQSPLVVTAASVCEKLRPKLAALMGDTGFRALLSRAVALASAEIPSLCKLTIDASDSLVYPEAIGGEAAAAADIEGSVVLVAQLLSLLVAFIGEILTRQVLREVWPGLRATDSNFKTGDSE
jgi:hypothetical protein